jgi:hypothetical protein
MNARQITVLALAVLQWITPSLSTFIDGLNSIGRSVNDVPPPEQPAGYAFGIWFLIFALSLAYAVRQALPSQRDNPVYARIGWLTAGAFAANSVWMVLAQVYGNGWYLVATIWTIWVFAVAATTALLFNAAHRDSFDRWITEPALAILAGWLTAAVWLNTWSFLKLTTVGTFGLEPVPFALAMVAAVIVTAVAVHLWLGRNRWYALTIAWALVAVGVANIDANPWTIATPVFALAVAAIVEAALIQWRGAGEPVAARLAR